MTKKIISFLAAVPLFGALHAKNPLITEQGYLNVDFNAAQMQRYADEAKQAINAEIAKIIAVPAPEKNFANGIAAFEYAYGEFHDRTQLLNLAAHFSPDAGIRKKSLEIKTAVEKFSLEIFTRKDLYAALKQADKNLTGQDAALAKTVLFQFEKNGMNLGGKDLKKFIKLKQRLIELETKFDETLSASKAYITLKEDELAGLSPTMISSMQKNAKGEYALDITPRSVYFAFLASSEIDAKRKEAEHNYQAIGGEKNLKTLDKMLKIREEIAKLFGFGNASDYILQDKMAKNYKTAAGFSADLVSKMQIKAAMENDGFLKIKRRVTGDPAAVALTEWDWRFYSNQYKKQNLDIDDEKIKEYFPTAHVIEKMTSLFGGVFGVEFERINVPVWHEDVIPYAVKENGKVAGYIYLDTIPRPGKYTHAECDDVITYRKNPDGTEQLPVAVLISNASLPGNGVPSLLSTTELGTLFHEFGHGLNFLFTRTPYGGLTSSLLHDIVETPSKHNEYWAASEYVLKNFSKHYQTGEKLSDAVIKNLQKARTSDMGNERLWFLTQVMFDLEVHAAAPKNTAEIMKVWERLNRQIRQRPMIKGGMRPAGFGHLAWGYASMYYCYDWADIIAADLFSVFDKKALADNKETGKKYRELILSIGKLKDEREQVKKFLGRDFNSDAYFKYMTGIDLAKMEK